MVQAPLFAPSGARSVLLPGRYVASLTSVAPVAELIGSSTVVDLKQCHLLLNLLQFGFNPIFLRVGFLKIILHFLKPCLQSSHLDF